MERSERGMTIFALEVENLSKVYGGRAGLVGERKEPLRAVDDLSFRVPRGIIFGLLGPNGAGKTTTLKILTTLRRPTGGSAKIEGFDVVSQSLEVRKRISLVLQETAIELFLSVRDNLLTYARFHGMDAREAAKRADQVMSLFELRQESERKVQDLSGGFKRRVQVAKAFLIQTPVLFLDEFSTGMDPILKRSVMDALRGEAARGRTIVLTTQILNEAEELCEDILILNKGREIARGNLNTLKLLSQTAYEIVMTFETLPEGIQEEIAKLNPLHVSIDGNTVEFGLKTGEIQALDAAAALARKGRVLRVEIGGASLEDVFVELTQKTPPAANL
jgi:ABC-2 type transport system ATP-binding protein